MCCTDFRIFRIGSEAVSLLTKAAPGFNGRVTLYIESSLPYIFVKVTCGVARRLSAATMRLTYWRRLRGLHPEGHPAFRWEQQDSNLRPLSCKGSATKPAELYSHIT